MIPTLARSAEEIQKAHDVLMAIALNEVPHELSAVEKSIVAMNLDVLCWVLGHDHNKVFAENLAGILAKLKAKGLTLFDSRTGGPS